MIDPPIANVTPVVEPLAPRLTVAGALGAKASVPGPVKLKPGEVIVTVALFVPTSLYLAGCGAPEQVSKTPGLLPHVSAPAWLMVTTSPAKLAPVKTITPKSRFCTDEIVSGLKILAVAVA